MSDTIPNPETRIALFRHKEIRRTIHNNEWWFVVEDVVFALTDSADPKQYIQRIKQRDPELSKGWVQIVHTLSMDTPGGSQKMLCANTEGLFRIIQSIPSPKAEPFKRWLAKVGYERIQEIEDPELATKRTRALYKAKGYSDDWIEKRMRSIAIRDELTDEWKKRGVKEQREYAILLIRRWVGRQTTVAQIVNLPYRRLAVGGLRYLANRVCRGETRRLPTCDTADCQSALLICRPAQGRTSSRLLCNCGNLPGHLRPNALGIRRVVSSENYLALTQSAKQAKELAAKTAPKRPRKS